MKPMGNSGDKLDLIAVLAGIDVQGLVERIALVFNAEFDFFGVAREIGRASCRERVSV